MTKTKKISLTEEEQHERNKVSNIKEIKDDFTRIGYAPNARKRFCVGEDVYVHSGGFISAKILEIIETDIYEVEVVYKTTKSYSSEEIVLTRKRILGWYDVFKLENKNCNIELGEDLRLNFMQQQISSLLSSYVTHFGVEFNPSYQRDLVWQLEDEQKLIESIFNRVDIGKFVFIHMGYTADLMYEILDGKQRLTALYRFFTDQFTYKGYYYSELPSNLKYVFEDTPISVASTRKEDLKEKDILNYFLKLNTSGKPVAKEHLDKIEKRFKEL
ncbi:MAG TPA: DUF262 domain-containing protein [Nitrososphaeraceae archaeon]|nr:DUF262 domain-containing protein [Nitrososphaeraceae archaeon]